MPDIPEKLDASPAAPSAGQFQRLGRKTLWVFIIDRISTAVVFLVIAIILLAVNENGMLAETPWGDLSNYGVMGALIASSVFIIAFAITLLVSWLIYANYQFALQDDAIKIRRGIFEREEIAIPYRQIQDVDIEQDITDRALGVCRLVVLTAGHEDEKKPEGESEGILPVLDRSIAEELQSELLKRANVQKVTEEK